ncbi:MAG: transcription termination factor NusA [Candidatus Shapirobacteria bacterium]|nr:transcription termination factor NusA [Candidatus Shapirobacteria bacterium]MDD4410760.1 transcription termination factor NusA [Candidatus Shapirobacteria bacterium]
MDLKKLPKTEFAAAVAQIAGERNIEVQSILDSIEFGLISAYKRDQKEHGIEVSEEDQFTAELAPENGSFKVYKIDGEKKTDVTPPGFGRIAAQTAKQVIDQRIHEVEKETVVAEFAKKIGTLIPCIVLKNDPYKMVVGVGKTEGICPKDEQIRNEIIPLGAKKLFLLKEIIRDETGRSEIILSRRDNAFISELFSREVPEVANGSVVLERIARTAGERSKVAVSSNQPGIDPVGSCIGQKGSRIQAILSELPTDEKVDVVAFSQNLNQFIAQALSPAQNVKVIEVGKNYANVTVPESQLALAIGGGGENVRLAGQLVGLEIKLTQE